MIEKRKNKKKKWHIYAYTESMLKRLQYETHLDSTFGQGVAQVLNYMMIIMELLWKSTRYNNLLVVFFFFVILENFRELKLAVLMT